MATLKRSLTMPYKAGPLYKKPRPYVSRVPRNPFRLEVRERLVLHQTVGVSSGSLLATLCAVPAGTGSSDRTGDEIRVLSIEVVGYPASLSPQAQYAALVLPKSNSAPTYANFATGRASLYDRSQGSTLAHYLTQCIGNDSGVINGKMKKNFYPPLLQYYDGPNTTSIVRNAVYLTTVNNAGGASSTIDATIRMLYVDQ